MYRVLPFLLICSLIVFAPAAVPAQDKDKDKDAKVDKDKDDAKKDDAKKDDAKKDDAKKDDVGKKDDVAKKDNGKKAGVTGVVLESEWQRAGRVAGDWAGVVSLVLLVGLVLLVVRLRADVQRLEEQVGKTPPPA
jgi:hypothetical protein